ncbi:cytidine deaminase [Petrotoga sp. 9PWA.NaAc.5.4]|nr:cytidine deaminase [Petrotoga sp. 9PWA.NaAc.5.4]
MDDKTIKDLYKSALNVRENAYVPYSNFKVGAAVLTETGEIFCGCNVENASFGLTICAERNSIFSAVAHGYKSFKALLVVADSKEPVKPCGACRQVMAEFGDFDVFLANLKGNIEKTKVSELLPYAFGSNDLMKE